MATLEVAEFVISATGMATEVGHISGMLQAQPTVKTPLTRQLDRLSRQLLLVAGVALIGELRPRRPEPPPPASSPC